MKEYTEKEYLELSLCEVYKMVQSGEMSYEVFEDWHCINTADSYSRGADAADYSAAVDYQS